jgi:hypothetical protein
MDGGVSFIAVVIIKLGAALGASTGLISLVKWFNSYEYKHKSNSNSKKGSVEDVTDSLESIRQKAGSKSKLY